MQTKFLLNSLSYYFDLFCFALKTSFWKQQHGDSLQLKAKDAVKHKVSQISSKQIDGVSVGIEERDNKQKNGTNCKPNVFKK